MEHRKKIEKALSFFGPDGSGNDDDFALLYEDGRRVAREYLRLRHCPDEDIEDIVQNVFLRMYQRRRVLCFTLLEQWYAYLYVAAGRGAIDVGNPTVRLEGQDIEDRRSSIADEVADRMVRDQLYEMADRVWLGDLPSEDGSLKVLTGRELYSDGKPPQAVFASVSRRCKGRAPSSPEALDAWVAEPAVLREIAYRSLYVSNERLTNILLEQEFQFRPEEVAVIRCRYRYGIPLAHVPISIKGGLSATQLSDLTARCQAKFPFIRVMTSLWNRMAGQPLRSEVLGKNPLWKRLVFQYQISDELPQIDILDRISPPAAVAGYDLQHVNTWVASRLREELRKHWEREGGHG